ncbi:lipopolysaccharide biosynthesis protein [Halopseudomonas bauzanensis]|uniref:lipopolysaccharide biosynthesis protein n=1 Tax=Halopseudomonas bauzanensis TaxID=653930 RepID=UPI0035244D13
MVGHMLSNILPKSNFSKNVITLMTGTTIAQAIPVAITPVLTRLYTPEDFGVLALFVAISSIFSSIACGRYELAIMLPEGDEDAINIAALGMLIAVVLSIFLWVPIFLFNREMSSLLGNKEIGAWLYLIPFVVLITGFYNVLNYLNTRKKLYKDIAKASIYKSIGMASVQLGIGFVKTGAAGLIGGQVAAQFIANYRLARNANKHYAFRIITKAEIIRLAKRYRDFPKFSMWAVLANSLANNLTSILISIYYGVSILGFHSFALKMLGVPASLIGTSIGQVFFQQATVEKKETGKAIKTFSSTSKKLIVISLLFFMPLFFAIPTIFEILFGESWKIAGEYGQILLPFVAIQFVVSALSHTNNIFERQKIALAWQVGLLVLSIGMLVSSKTLDLDFIVFLKVYTLIISLYYIALYFILMQVSRGRL